ncbi:MAG: sugar transferase, partial [Clostridia bacterium]|nr:sugar transferase [Clostridia bacterium]
MELLKAEQAQPTRIRPVADKLCQSQPSLYLANNRNTRAVPVFASAQDRPPEIFNINAGRITIAGPGPAFRNREDLAPERDKYGANGVKPGQTSRAQINGRDEPQIPVEAEPHVRKQSFFFECKCFFRTIKS